MHEYAVTREIIHIAERHAGGAAVSKINLVVGDYSGFVAESIELYFGIIAEGTACENAALDIERVAPQLRCKACGGLFSRRPFEFDCPVCGGDGAPSEVGREFYVRSVEVDGNQRNGENTG
ncbi:hypothetical protein FACS1894217_03430 [Clostridia bacterium]|nr:hypothetical protein FACS1894217_03430 [Clostridia bacterium]